MVGSIGNACVGFGGVARPPSRSCTQKCRNGGREFWLESVQREPLAFIQLARLSRKKGFGSTCNAVVLEDW